jgi:glycosyltransferase involved in cell wall biosynthesis
MNYKQSILFVVHNSVHNTSFGGVETYLNNLTKYLSDEFDVYWYVPGLGKNQNSIYVYEANGNITQEIAFDSVFINWQLSCPEREAAFARVLQELKIGLVHFYHLAGQPPSLVKIAKDSGVSTVFTFHDFYSICHVSNLINFEGRYCQPDTLAPADCDACLNKKYAIEPGSQGIRRAYWNNLFTDIDGLIFNTQGSFELVAKIYPNVANHPKVEILPVAIESIEIPKVDKRDSDELRVAILGNFVYHKGADVILDAIKNLTSENISFHFFGGMEDIYEGKIKLSNNPKINRYGEYPSGKLPIELFSCDVSLHVSICPETYGLALSESWAAGLVPIVSNIGALGERVSHLQNGFKVGVNSVGELVELLREMTHDLKLLQSTQKPLENLPISFMEGHAKDLHHFYSSLIYKKIISFKLAKLSVHNLQDPEVLKGAPLYWAKFSKVFTDNLSKNRLIKFNKFFLNKIQR